MSKVLERLVCEQLHAHLQREDLLPKFQSAYRKHHSVETALLRVQNDILLALDAHQGVVLVLLDLSAAFDTVSHEYLTQRLHSRFRLRGSALNWIRSYLEGRTQTVCIGDRFSSSLEVKHGVPQGSVL